MKRCQSLPGCCNGRYAHSIPDKDDNVLGMEGILLAYDIKGLIEIINPLLFPIGSIFGDKRNK